MSLANAAGDSGLLGTDFRSFEVLMATCVGLSVPVWSAVLLSLSALGDHANAPAITTGNAIPIKVKPVVDLDSPLLKKGGKQRYKLPDLWNKPEPKPETPTVKKRKAHVSTKAKDEVKDIPPPDLEVSDAGKAPDPDAEVVADTPLEIESDPDAAVEGQGGGSAAGSEHGTETDPLKARAANLYHGRISGFLYGGWSCPAGAQPSCTATATMTISGLTVSSASFNGCGDPALDAAARAHAQGKVGQSIPPPPENYPDLAPSNFNVSYRCK